MSIGKSSSKGNMDKSLNNSITLDLSNHNLNNSSSKQKFSFPKASRFNLTKSICDSFYDVPTTKNGRSTSFGYGMKDMGIRTSRYAPEPASYNIQSEFQSSKKQRRGTSFGPGRQQMEIGGPLKDSIARKYIPGPGNYNTSYTTLDNRHMTIKSRLPDKSQNHLLRNPGPGTYNLQELGAKDYVTSKFQNRTNLTKISPSSGHKELISTKTIDVVGPGQYNQTERAMNAEGKYFLSKNKNSGSRQFSKSPRESLVYKHLLQTPGPMRYQHFSEFGS